MSDPKRSGRHFSFTADDDLLFDDGLSDGDAEDGEADDGDTASPGADAGSFSEQGAAA